MNQKPIEDATDAELRKFAETALSADLTGADTRAKVLSLIQTMWAPSHILVESSDEPQDGTAEAKPIQHIQTGRDDGPLTKFRILQTEMPGGKHPAHPSVNGRMLVMQRNMLIEAPYAYYLALLNAKVGSIEQAPEKDGKPGELITLEVTNYPLSDVVLPPQHEIDAWHERNGSRLLAA